MTSRSGSTTLSIASAPRKRMLREIERLLPVSAAFIG
jgi:hypothetical protein